MEIFQVHFSALDVIMVSIERDQTAQKWFSVVTRTSVTISAHFTSLAGYTASVDQIRSQQCAT